MKNNLADRIRRGEAAIAAARSAGRIVADWEQRLAQLKSLAETEETGMDPTEGEIVSVLICSHVLHAEVWFALRDGWKPEEGDMRPVFYAHELPALRTKTAAQLRQIFAVKSVFGGGSLRQ